MKITFQKHVDEFTDEDFGWTNTDDGYDVIVDGEVLDVVTRREGVSPGYYGAWTAGFAATRVNGGSRQEAAEALVAKVAQVKAARAAQ